MFELRLQIGLYGQKSSAKKREFLIEIRFNLTKSIFEIMEAKVYYNTIWVYAFLEHIIVFLCKVQGV